MFEKREKIAKVLANYNKRSAYKFKTPNNKTTKVFHQQHVLFIIHVWVMSTTSFSSKLWLSRWVSLTVLTGAIIAAPLFIIYLCTHNKEKGRSAIAVSLNFVWNRHVSMWSRRITKNQTFSVCDWIIQKFGKM